jgi:hypothetical protein
MHGQKPYSQISTVYSFLIKLIRCLKGRMIVITVLVRFVIDKFGEVENAVKDDSDGAA